MNQNSLTVDLVAWIIIAMAAPWWGKIIIAIGLWLVSYTSNHHIRHAKLADKPRRIF